MKAHNIPKQFFVEIQKWIDKGCPEFGEIDVDGKSSNPFKFIEYIGLCGNLDEYFLATDKDRDGYGEMKCLFKTTYPFGEYDGRENLYLDTSNPSVQKRLAFIKENLV